MRTLLVFTLLLPLLPPAQDGAATADDAPVAVLAFKWAKSRQTVAVPDASGTAPAAAMIPANRNFERNRRINDPPAARDPNGDTIDGRSAAIEKNVRESRTPKPKTAEGFAYSVKVRNAGAKAVEVLFLEYQFTEAANPANVVRRQFLCGVQQLKPSKERELHAFSLAGPSDAISAASLSNKSGSLYRERAVVNRVEYADGSIWQRKGWNYAEVKSAVARAVSTPWGQETCRGL